MTGKPREDRTTIAGRHLGLRLTAYEGALLDGLVDAANAKLEAQGLPALMSQTALVRLLIEQEAARQQIEVPARLIPKGKKPAKTGKSAYQVTLEQGQTARAEAKVKQGQGT